MTHTTPMNRKVQVARTDHPSTDRYVSLSTHRLLGTTVYVVGVVDATGRLAEPKTLRSTTDLDKARKHANALTDRWGGPLEPADAREFLPRINGQQGQRKRSKNRPPGNVTEVFPIFQGKLGRFNVGWHEHGIGYARYLRFNTEQEAQSFHDHLTTLMKENRR